MFLKSLRTSVIMIVLFTVLTGFIYPLLVTGIAQILFPGKANGSMVMKGENVVGSGLIGQAFKSPKYFWGRPSATSPYPYNAGSSSGSNYGPLNPALLDATAKRVKELKEADPQNTSLVPVDLVTASASGLDPHISLAAAQYQVSRVARSRGVSESAIKSLVDEYTEARQLGILGETRVNVLKLNIALDEMKSTSGGR